MSEKIDLGFVIREPPENSLETFEDIKKAVLEITKRLNINVNNVLPGVVTYGRTAGVVLRIGVITTKNSAVYELSKVQPPVEPGSNVKDALQKVVDQLFNVNYGARRDAKKSLYVFVDEIPDRGDVKEVLKQLKEKDVKVIFIMFGAQGKKDDMKKATLDADDWFFPDNTDDLKDNIDPVVDTALPGKLLLMLLLLFYPP